MATNTFKIGNFEVSRSSRPFVIAEIGHNHQGNLETALQLIKAAHEAGASAVKFQKRDNKNLFTKSAFDAPYSSENSFGETYGKHREALEFGKSEYKVCKEYSESLGIEFFSTAFDFSSLEFLEELDMPAYKIASGDLKNIPLISEISKTGKPVIMSTGGGEYSDIDRAVAEVQKHHNKLALLQCTAGYPPNYEELNLRVISSFLERYQDIVIGYSGHDSGIAMSTVAYVLGARVIEKHFTLNRAMRGTDHSFSLEPQGLKKLVRDLQRTELALGDGLKKVYESENAPLIKMGKSIVASKNLKSGETLKLEDISFKSPGGGIPPYEYANLIGLKLTSDINEDEKIVYDVLQGD